MKRSTSFLQDLFLVFILLKMGRIGFGADMTFFEMLFPGILILVIGAFNLIAVFLGWDDDYKIWSTAKVAQVLAWKNAKKRYKQAMRNAVDKSKG